MYVLMNIQYHTSDYFEYDSGRTTELSVMWYYTSQFNSVTSDPALYISGLINNANAAYANSNINLKLKTKCVEQLPDNFMEGNSVGTLLEELVNVKGNLKFRQDKKVRIDWEFPSERHNTYFHNPLVLGSPTALRQTADISLLVTSTYINGACGAVSKPSCCITNI